MKFRFIGDPRNNFSGPDALEKFGLHFNRTEWTEVSDARVISKLLGHSHFESAGAFPKTGAPHVEAAAGDPREALIAEAEAIGIDVDRRWSNATIRKHIDGRRNENP